MAKLIHSPEEFLKLKTKWRDLSVGFVPTMGALHIGHEALLEKSRSENDISVLSIFVNPTQFNDKTDFEKYPNTFSADLKIAEEKKTDIVFAPQFSQMYPDNYHYKIIEDSFSKELCGKSRPGHFDGVLSVVMKLFQIVSPQRAYFGEKDFQQLSLIRGMTQAYFLPIDIIAVPTVREKDGLAMSSRNIRLNPQQRALAPRIFQIINQANSASVAREQLNSEGFKVDYVEDFQGRRFVAVHLGEVRLIDNIQI